MFPRSSVHSRSLALLGFLSLCSITVYIASIHGPRIAYGFRPENSGNRMHGTLADVRAILTDRSLLHEDFAYAHPAEGNTLDAPFPVFGTALAPIKLDASLLDTNGTNGDPFNPAILRLPEGLQWEYVVVARGPGILHEDLIIGGKKANEQTLIGFGANGSSLSSSLIAVSKATYLSLPQNSSAVCGEWAFTFGPEDPRLLWSDAFTPMLTFGMTPSDPALCRSIGLVPDLRRLWPQLERVLRGVPDIPRTDHRGPPSIEITKDGQSKLEKNWVPFFPGAGRLPTKLPHFHYSIAPAVVLVPDSASHSSSNSLASYTPQPHSSSADCVTRNHPHIYHGLFHHATPLYRLTLCPRGCVPDFHNTVLIALAHARKIYPQYGRFVITWNVTAPHDLISVGPQFRFANSDDKGANFALGIAFLPSPFVPPSALCMKGLLPSHGFLDDDAIISLGVHDSGMGTARIPVRELLQGGRMCDLEATF